LLAWSFTALFAGSITVVTTFVAQDFGAGAVRKIKRHSYTAITLIPFFTVAVWALIPWFPDMIRVMGTDATVAPLVTQYLNIRILGMPFLLMIFALNGFLRGLGEMRAPMINSIVANAINAVLSVILVFGLLGFPKMGIAGAATASVFGAFCEALFNIVIFWSKKHNDLYQTRSMNFPHVKEIRRFAKVGLPIGLMWIADMLVWTLFSMYSATLDPVSLAAHVILFQVLHLSFLPAAAIAVTGQTLVGQYIGAKRIDLATKAANRSMAVGIGFMTCAAVLMSALRYPMITVFNADPEVIRVGVQLTLIAALFQPFDGACITISGVLRGAGDTYFPLYAVLFSGIIIFVPCGYLLGETIGWGIYGAWFASLIYVVTFATLVGYRYWRGAWKTMSI
jgi:putative MATE family efflux protein